MVKRKVEATLTLGDELTKKLSGIDKRFQAFTRKVEARFKRVSRAISRPFQLALAPLRLLERQILNVRNLLLGFGAFKFVEFVGRVENADRAFQSLAHSVGESSAAILQGLRKATRGTVSDLELMRQANVSITLGVASTAEEFERLFGVATDLARAMGITTVAAINSLNTGVARQSRLLLDNVGIIVSAELAYSKMAEELNTVVSALTKAQKQQAFFNEVLEQGERKGRAVAKLAETTGTRLERLQATFSNITADIARAFGPAIQQALEKITKFLIENQPRVFGFFAELLNAARIAIPAIVRLAQSAAEAIGLVFAPILKVGSALQSLQLLNAERRLRNATPATVAGPFGAPSGVPPDFDAPPGPAPLTPGARARQVENDPNATPEQRAAARAFREARASFDSFKAALDGTAASGGILSTFDKALLDAAAALTNLGKAQEKSAEQIKAERDAAQRELRFASSPIGRFFEEDTATQAISPADAQVVLNELFNRGNAVGFPQGGVNGSAFPARDNTPFFPTGARKSEGFSPVFNFDRELPTPGAADIPEQVSGVTQAVEGATEAMRELDRATRDWGAAAADAVFAVADSITNNLTNGIVDAINSYKSFGDAVRDTSRAILVDLQRIIIRMLLLRAVGAAAGFFAGGPSSTAAPEGGFGGEAAGVGGTASSARGNVFRESAVTRIAEGGRPEAVLPLVRTSSGDLAVQAAGSSAGAGGGQNITINVMAMDAASFDERILSSMIRQRSSVANITAQTFRDSRQNQALYQSG